MVTHHKATSHKKPITAVAFLVLVLMLETCLLEDVLDSFCGAYYNVYKGKQSSRFFAIVRFRSTDDAALWLLCLAGETTSIILFLMKLYVILDKSLAPGVKVKAGFAARCTCYRSIIGLGLLPLFCRNFGFDPVIPNESIIACRCVYSIVRSAASSAKVVWK